MRIQYLEIVTKEVEAVCAAYASTNGVRFGEPDAGLGNARTVALPGGGLVGVRAPLRETEEPVIRPYWLVNAAAIATAVQAGAVVAFHPWRYPVMEHSPFISKVAMTTACGSSRRRQACAAAA